MKQQHHQKKTILFVEESLQRGGNITVLRNYVETLKNEFNIIILSQRSDLTSIQSYFGSDVKILLIDFPFKTGLVHRFHSFLSFAFQFYKLHKKNKIDIVHTGTTYAAFYYFATKFLMRFRAVPVVVTFHGDFSLEAKSWNQVVSKYEWLKIKIKKSLQSYMLHRASKIIVLSNYSKKVLLSNFTKVDDKVVKIPPYTKLTESRKAIRKKASGKLTIVNFGRAEPRKGIPILLDALHNLSLKGIEFRALIASPVNYLQFNIEILRTYEDFNLFRSVHFLHGVNEQQKRELLSEADLFVLPSLDLETFGLTMLEALSYGVPVIGTPVGAIPEVLGMIDKRLIAKEVTAESLSDQILTYANLSTNDKRTISNKINQVLNNSFTHSKSQRNLLRLFTKYC